MIGERENNFSETEYGSLVMRPYNISGNDIDAFYDANDNLVFVLDKTLNDTKPNVLLVINPESDRKWDEILANDYGVDLEYVRPKQDNKYQKLDIEYSGLSVYENLINAYVSGDGIEDNLVQLDVLRNSAARHSAMTRLNAANEIITRTNATIVKTKESIVRLETRLKTLRAKLADMKKEIGRVAPKQSAAKILRTESQIDSTKEKIKRAQKRLESAERRLETATIDAQLASNLLNQPGVEIKQPAKNKPVIVAPRHEVQTVVPDDETVDDDFDGDATDDNDEGATMDDDNNEIKPLFDKDPEIINDEIAFKPVSFDASDLPITAPAPAFPTTLEVPDSKQEHVEKIDDLHESVEPAQPVLESLTPIMDEPLVAEPVIDDKPVISEKIHEPEISETPVEPIFDPADDVKPSDVQPAPAVEGNRPASPAIVEPMGAAPVVVDGYDDKKTKSSFLYYMLLLILIGLSVFALWMYQKNMGSIKPLLSMGKSDVATVAEKTVVAETGMTESVLNEPEVIEDVFVDEPVAAPEVAEPVIVEPTGEADVEESEPFIMDVVSEKISAFSNIQEPEYVESEENDIVYEPVVNKPVYGAAEKHTEMFVYEDDTAVAEDSEYDEEYSEPVVYNQPVYSQTDEQYVNYVDDTVFVDEPDSNFVGGYDDTVYAGDVYYEDGVYYDDYDPEEVAYQAGDDGYDEYR